ncbi:hypothetical protein K450DRAFT_223950 [Umbelopsis ramanniana AG]|uniref:PARP catalytic domain-containing protein n=1 Tax=Umbelopsis ramanniana AG TaxID=1314678 RepID=A0AAD5EGE9_UMBRA|nr:uncharacterized protein K450DRAFT_223950 [Umbelopsis ramanniana AG]KAI8583044.1 hypothetical protein K450DRAFT_223950 [Umbelopsis ramanniana AG]
MFSYGYLHNNEYIVYDPAQVRMKYLVVVQNKRYCPVCTKQTENGSLKRMQDFNFCEKDYKHNMKRCNEYESTLICMQMVYQGTDAQKIYQEGIENQLAALETNPCGADKLSPAMRLNKTTSVCTSCANDIKDRLLINWFKKTTDGIPAEVRHREDCKWGYECITQHKSLDHAKLYNHLCVKTAE